MKLSSKGLKQVNLSLYENDFTFSFNDKEFKCPAFVAEFISLKVSKQREKDPTTNRINIKFEVKSDETFVRLRKLISGETVNVDENKNEDELVNLLVNIGNEDSIDIDNEISIENVIEKLKYKHSLGIDTKSEIEFIAEHFEELKNNELNSDFLPLILDSNKLKLENEKSLLDFVIEQVKKDNRSICLVKYIHCEYLSEGEEIEEYVKLIDSIDSIEIIGSLWPSLRKHFVAKEAQNEERFIGKKGIEFKSDKGTFNGIIKYLSDECGGNVIDKNVIDASASSDFQCLGYQIRNVVQEDGNWSTSSDDIDQWLKFDFKDKKILVKGYSLQSNASRFGDYIRSWCLEGSNDNSYWDVIDQRSDQECMNGALNIGTYNDIKSKKEYRYLRIRRIGKTWYNNNYLPVGRIEFYGNLII